MLNLCEVGRPVADIINTDKSIKPISVFVDDKDEKKKSTKLKNENFFNELELKSNEHFQPVANPKADRFVIYISGPQGSGKSYWIGNFLSYWKKQHGNKDKQIFLFSLKDTDTSLDKIKPLRIKIDSNLVRLDWKDFEGQTVIFDDVDSISDKAIKQLVYSIVDNIINVGRSYKINCILTNHAPTDAKFTRTALNSADMIVYFPNSGSKYGLNYLLKNYVGLSKQDIEDIKKLKSRAITIYKNYPQIILSERKIYLLNSP